MPRRKSARYPHHPPPSGPAASTAPGQPARRARRGRRSTRGLAGQPARARRCVAAAAAAAPSAGRAARSSRGPWRRAGASSAKQTRHERACGSALTRLPQRHNSGVALQAGRATRWQVSALRSGRARAALYRRARWRCSPRDALLLPRLCATALNAFPAARAGRRAPRRRAARRGGACHAHRAAPIEAPAAAPCPRPASRGRAGAGLARAGAPPGAAAVVARAEAAGAGAERTRQPHVLEGASSRLTRYRLRLLIRALLCHQAGAQGWRHHAASGAAARGVRRQRNGGRAGLHGAARAAAGTPVRVARRVPRTHAVRQAFTAVAP